MDVWNRETFDISEWNARFLPSEGETCFNTMDGADVAAFLERMGEKVERHFDAGRNGWAVTESGYMVSTDGYVCRRFSFSFNPPCKGLNG